MENPILDLYAKKKGAEAGDGAAVQEDHRMEEMKEPNPLLNLYARKKDRNRQVAEAKPQVPTELTAPWRAYTDEVTPEEELSIPQVLRPGAVKKYRFQQGTAVPAENGMTRLRGESPEYARMLNAGLTWEDADGALVRQAMNPSRNVFAEETEARKIGDVVLPSGTILRRKDMKGPNVDIGTFFRQVVEPGIAAAEGAAEKRYNDGVVSQYGQTGRTWGESIKAALRAVPLGGEASAAQLARQAGESRRERGPARIVQDVLAGISPERANAYIADHLKDDTEFAAAAEKFGQVVPAQDGPALSDEELQQAVASMTPEQRKQYDKRVAKEQQRIADEQEALGKAAGGAWTREAEKFRQGITGQLVEEMARRNMPKNELEAFARTAYNASIPGLLMEWAAGNVAGDDGNKALNAQIMQRAMEKYDPTLATKIGGDVVGLLLGGPMFSAGGAAGQAGAAGLRKLAERSVMKRLMSRGITEGAEGVARRLVAGNTAQRLAQGAVASGMTLGSYDAVAAPLAMAAAGEDVNTMDVLGAAGRGFATGMLLPGIGMAAGRAADAATSRLGRYAAELGGFAAENAVFVGMGTLYEGLRTGEWGSPEQLAEEFGHSVGVLGIMKSIGALKRGRAKNPVFYDKVLAETEFTPEEVAALDRAGVDGRSYKRAVFDLLNAKENVGGREVAEQAAEQLGSRYAKVMQSPEVPISAKAKMMYLVEGHIPARAPLTTDVRRTVGEDGRTTVDLMDPAGNLVQRRTLSTERAADAFERESAPVREINTIQYYENRLEEQRSRTALDDAAQTYASERGMGVEAVRSEVLKAAQGQPHDTETVRQVVDRARPLREQYDDVPAMMAEGIALKHGLGEGDLDRALMRKKEVRTPREREAVAEYAFRLKEFASQERQETDTPERRAERQLMQVAEEQIVRTRNMDDDVIYTATMQDGRQANIIKGARLVYDPETGEVDAAQSEPTVVVRYEDGTTRQVAVEQIDMIVEAVSADDTRAAALKTVRTQLDAAAREDALAEAAGNGGMVQMKDGRIGVIEGVNSDGTVSVAILDDNGQIVAEQFAAEEIVGPVETEQVPESQSVKPVVQPEEEAVTGVVSTAQKQVVAAPEAQTPEIPRTKGGQPDFNAMPSEMLAVELSETFGHDKAVERLQVARKVHAKEVEKLRKAQDNISDLNKAIAIEQRIGAIEQDDARLTGALEQLGAVEAPAAAKETGETFIQEIDRLFPEGLPNVRTRILSDIARGQRFVWNDSPDKAKRGMATELGFSGNESERRARFGLLGTEATGAKHVSRYVHDLWEDSSGYAFDMDDAALRNKVIDVLLTTPSRAAAMEQLRDLAARNAEDTTIPRDAEDQAAIEAYKSEQEALRQSENNGIFVGNTPEVYGKTEKSGRDNDNGIQTNPNFSEQVASDTAGAAPRISDRGDIRVFEEGLGASYNEYSEHSERDRREAESERLVAIAKESGLYIDPKEWGQFGQKYQKRTGESVVYIDKPNGKVYKIKAPYAKAAIRGGAPEDAIYDHIIHNMLFPEARYAFEGISDHLGDARIVLSQDYIDTYRQPTQQQIDAALAGRGLFSEDKYTYGNNLVSVTDVEGDNALLGQDGRIYFIDPIIKLKKPAREVIEELERRAESDDVPFSVMGDAVAAPEGVTPERWSVIVDHLRQVIGTENVVTDPVAVRAAYDEVVRRGSEVRRHQVEQANERFNEQLELFTDGKLLSGDKIGLGTPGATLRACGIHDADMTVTQRVLKDHMDKHGLTADDIRDLPAALENPVMVYEWGGKAKSTIVVTEIPRENERIAVALRFRQTVDGVRINKVVSVHGKSIDRLLTKMNTPLSDFGTENLKWIDKEKASDWLVTGGSYGPSASDQRLVTAVNIVTNFENPKIGPENSLSENVGFFRTPDGEVYGFTTGGKIYLDSTHMNAETPMHEYIELWSQYVAKINPELWQKGVELLKGTYIWDQVNADSNYKNLTEDLRASETLARIGAAEFSHQQKRITDSAALLGKLRAWMRKFWGALKETFSKWTTRELNDLTARQFARMSVRDFVEGIDLQKATSVKLERRRPAGHKEQQLNIINHYNPMLGDVNTGIRKVEDIKSFNEVVADAKQEGDVAYPDMSIGMLDEAAKTGKITVYSSYPINQGVFITPSRMNAEGYAGGPAGGRVYSMEVSVDDVAWIAPDEGQYAKVIERKKNRVVSDLDTRFSRDFTQRQVTTLEKLEDKRVALIADRENIANFDEQLSAVEIKIEAERIRDRVLETWSDPGSEAHLRAVEDAVYDMQREMNIPTQTEVVRSGEEFIARLRKMGATDEDLEGLTAQHCPEGSQWKDTIILRADGIRNQDAARVIYMHEQAHSTTKNLFLPDELYDAAAEMGADYMNGVLERLDKSYHVDADDVISMIEGANEMISRVIGRLQKEGWLEAYFATENGPIYPVIMYLEEIKTPTRLKGLVVENLKNIKADIYGTERTREGRRLEIGNDIYRETSERRNGDMAADKGAGKTSVGAPVTGSGVEKGYFPGKGNDSGPEIGSGANGDNSVLYRTKPASPEERPGTDDHTRLHRTQRLDEQTDALHLQSDKGSMRPDEQGDNTGQGEAGGDFRGIGHSVDPLDNRGRVRSDDRIGVFSDLDRLNFSLGDPTEAVPKLTRQQQLIADLRRAVRESKATARAVAQIVSRRVREDVGRDLVDVMGKREFDALIRQIEQATARQDIERPLQRIASVVLDLEIKQIQAKIDKFLQMKVQGETPRGVALGKVVDDQTRQVFEIFRDNIGRPGDVVMQELQNRDDLDYFSVLDSTDVLDVYNDTLRYRRDIADIKREQVALYKENTELRKQRIEANRAGNIAGFVALQTEIAGRKELIEALDAEEAQCREHLKNGLKIAERFLSDLFGMGREIFTDWHEQQDARRKEIVATAFRDAGDGKRIPVLERQRGVWEKGYRRTMDFLLSPAYSMAYLLKMISVNAPKGEGALYDHFMRGRDGYVETRGRYWLGYEDFKRVLDEKAREVFGKSYPEVIADSAAPTDAEIRITNGKVKETFSPSIGEALYIYMADKMDDGRVKLRRMNISEQDVEALAGILPPQYVRFADWLQNEFLPARRKAYNATHLDVFGAQMAKIENYVPLKVAKGYVFREVRGDEPDPDTLPSAITGSIIRRTRNELPINLHTNALDLMLEHGQQMEHWNAFTRVVRDMNALLSSTAFRRMLDNRNPGLHHRLKVAAQLAADTYRPQANDVNRAWIALGKLAATSKIAFRVNTALKQVLSYPAFYAYAPDPEFWKLLTKNLAPTTWAKNFRWCIDNIPSFRERWMGRMVGDEKLAQMTAPALDRWLDKMNKYGMFPNALIDAQTCANGAMAVYDYRRAKYMERGKDATEAERLARIDAAVAINVTQQSGEGMYLGQMQADRDFWSVSLSTFQNSNFAYLRKQLEGIDELFRDAKREQTNRANYYKEQGFTEEEAFDRALAEVVEAKRGAWLNIAVFMFGLNMLWALGNNVWKYLFAPDTREDIPGELAKSALMAPIRNTTVGSIAESFANGYDANPSVLLSDMVSFTKRLRRVAEQENPDAWNETAAYLAMQTLTANGLGIDLESFVNMCQGIVGMIRYGADVEDVMRMLNAPQSQAKLIAGKPKEGETPEQYRERMIFTERRIASRVGKKRLDKWSRNYTAYRQAETLGMEAERDKFGSVTVPELKRPDAEYVEALKRSGVTTGGNMRQDFDWLSLTPDGQEQWRQRARLAWKIREEEKALDTVVIFNARYAERMRQLMKWKQEYVQEIENNK